MRQAPQLALARRPSDQPEHCITFDEKMRKPMNDQITSIVVEVGHEAEGEGPPEVTEPEELGLLVILT